MAKDMVLWKKVAGGWFEPTFIVLSNKSADYKRMRHKDSYKFVEKSKSDALERKESQGFLRYEDL